MPATFRRHCPQKKMQTLPIRLLPGDDLRKAVEQALSQSGGKAAFVIAGIGSLKPACLRLADQEQPEMFPGNFEILTLMGSVSPDGAHLHISVADESGKVTGAHVSYGCIIDTTAEILLLILPEWSFSRNFDPATGFPELIIRKAATNE